MYRIHRACSHWKYFDESLGKAKSILEQNQYPPQFYDPIIEKTISKIVSPPTNERASDEPDQQVKVMVFLPYRGQITDSFVKKLKESGAPVQPVLTLRKLRTVLPSLKPSTKVELRSRVVYKITCPGCGTCYVGQTRRHLLTRFREHKNCRLGAVCSHFRDCLSIKPSLANVKILASSSRDLEHLLTMEALYIRQFKPELNTKDEYRSRELRIRF